MDRREASAGHWAGNKGDSFNLLIMSLYSCDEVDSISAPSASRACTKYAYIFVYYQKLPLVPHYLHHQGSDMPHHHHEHGSCQGEGHSHDGHSHDTPVEDIPRSTLYQIIDHDNVVVYNVVDKTKKVIKPWDQRNDEAIVSTIPLCHFMAGSASVNCGGSPLVVSGERCGRRNDDTGPIYRCVCEDHVRYHQNWSR